MGQTATEEVQSSGVFARSAACANTVTFHPDLRPRAKDSAVTPPLLHHFEKRIEYAVLRQAKAGFN